VDEDELRVPFVHRSGSSNVQEYDYYPRHERTFTPGMETPFLLTTERDGGIRGGTIKEDPGCRDYPG
jgi:hypothetical protein